MARAPLPPRADIVRALSESPRAMHPRELAGHLGVPEGAYPRFQELLDQLALEGVLRQMPGHRFKAQAAPAEREGWEGVLSVNPRGFGFVAAAGQDDVFVPAEALGGALHGDRVRVSVVARTGRGVEGRVEAVVARRNPRVAGLLRRRGKALWLEPDDTRVRGPIVLATSKDGRDGEAAVATITRFPESISENPEGELVTVLGTPGEPRVEIAKILVREQLEEDHPAEVLREAEEIARRLNPARTPGRVDLRAVPLPTIDPEDARDHDDAVWVERQGTGYRAWIAIADVSEYVRPGTALDAEAFRRGCTTYLPDRAIPMLPRALAADLCSLVPEHDRLCVAVIADLDAAGSVKHFEVVEGVMRSAAMLTYGGVARALGLSELPRRERAAEAMKGELAVLAELTAKLRKRRLDRGALDMNLPEAKVELDPTSGAPVTVTRRAEDPGVKRAYNMIEELMLLANELTARFLGERQVPTVYRVHGKPDEQKLERLAEVAEKLGVAVDLADLEETKGVSHFLASVAKHPRRAVLEMLLLRSLKQATYDITNIGHFGLASGAYLHFTSPIRRYPDLLVHRAMKALLRGEARPGAPTAGAASALEELRNAATWSSQRERAAAEVEREVVDLYRCLHMRERVGEEFDGTVTALVGTGLFVALDEPFVDVLVRFEALGPDIYEATDDELGAVGLRSGDAVMLGDRVRVLIEDVAILRRQTYGRRVVSAEQVAAAEARRGTGARGAERGAGRGAGAPARGAGGARGAAGGARAGHGGRTSGGRSPSPGGSGGARSAPPARSAQGATRSSASSGAARAQGGGQKAGGGGGKGRAQSAGGGKAGGGKKQGGRRGKR